MHKQRDRSFLADKCLKKVSPYENIQVMQNEKEVSKTFGRNEVLQFDFHTFLHSMHFKWGTMLRGEKGAYGLIYDGFRMWVNIMSITYG